MDDTLEYEEHITSDGDTFDLLALNYYDDELLASVIMQANPDYANWLVFCDGITLRIPIIEETATLETLPPWRREA